MRRDSSNYKILVIEDNLGGYMLVEDYIEEMMANTSIGHCENFKEAASIFSDENFQWDVILLDLSLPDKSREKLILGIL